MGTVRKADVLNLSTSSTDNKKAKPNVGKGFKFTVEAMMNKERTKVLFLEVGNDFADVLLSFLTLPLSTILMIFKNHHFTFKSPRVVIGSLNTLRRGLYNLHGEYFWTWAGSRMMLDCVNPFAQECRKLIVNIDITPPTRYFTCLDSNCKKKGTPSVCTFCTTCRCDHCGKLLCKELSIKELDTGSSGRDGGGFTRKETSFLISDDLQIMPNVPGSMIQILNKQGITDVDGDDLECVYVGLSEFTDLLKLSLFSKTPLTDVILNNGHVEMGSATACSERRGGISSHQMEIDTSSNTNKKMIVKAMVQKSTNKFLFLQSEDDFVEFLFSFLNVPLGGVARLLGGKTSLGSIDNLYRSVSNLDSDKHMKNPETKEELLNPKLPPMHRSEYHILPLEEQKTPIVYYYPEGEGAAEFVSPFPEITFQNEETKIGSLMSFKDPKGGSSFVKRPGVFLVTDDLKVEPSCVSSTLYLFSKLKIPISDVREQEIEIGLKEGLSILRASLTSANALTNGLSSILMKQPKQKR